MNQVGTFISSFTTAEKKLDDYTILGKVKAGEFNFFEILIRRYNERLYHIARGYLKDEFDVEDIMQETYIKAFESLHQFQGRSQFSTWITRILINTALAKLNQANSHSNIDIDDLLVDEDKNFQLLIQEQNQEQKVMRRNLLDLLETAIDQLPEKYRLVFMMRVVENMSINETAECLEITSDNVKVRLFRAKNILKGLLQDTATDLDLFGFYLDRCDRITKSVLQKIGAH